MASSPTIGFVNARTVLANQASVNRGSGRNANESATGQTRLDAWIRPTLQNGRKRLRHDGANGDGSVTLQRKRPRVVHRTVEGTRAGKPFDPSEHVVHIKAFLGAYEAQETFAALDREIIVRQKKVLMWERLVDEPRLTAFYVRRSRLEGTTITSYRRDAVVASKSDEHPPDFTPLLETLCCRVEDALDMPRGTYNAVLVNKYRTGADHVSWHSDNGPIDRANIASLSLGAARDFNIRSKADERQKVTYYLESGDLVHMRGACQDLYQHQVPKRARVSGARINLTFRRLLPC